MAELLIDQCSIPVQDGQGDWHNVSMREATHRQFYDWARLTLHQHFGRWFDLGEVISNADEREQVVRFMVGQGIVLEEEEGGPNNG